MNRSGVSEKDEIWLTTEVTNEKNVSNPKDDVGLEVMVWEASQITQD